MGMGARKQQEEEGMSTSKAREKFADLIEQVHFNKKRVVIVRRGKPAAALIPVEDLALLERFEREEDARDLEEMEEAKREQGDAPLVPWAQVKANAGLK